MNGGTLANLKEYHVYKLDGMLVEAACCEVWTLIVLRENGEYIPKEHGALVAFQLRSDGVWDSLYHCYSDLLPGGDPWTVVYGDALNIDPSRLEPVAESRLFIQAEFHEQELDRRFYEIMAEMEW